MSPPETITDARFLLAPLAADLAAMLTGMLRRERWLDAVGSVRSADGFTWNCVEINAMRDALRNAREILEQDLEKASSELWAKIKERL